MQIVLLPRRLAANTRSASRARHARHHAVAAATCHPLPSTCHPSPVHVSQVTLDSSQSPPSLASLFEDVISSHAGGAELVAASANALSLQVCRQLTTCDYIITMNHDYKVHCRHSRFSSTVVSLTHSLEDLPNTATHSRTLASVPLWSRCVGARVKELGPLPRAIERVRGENRFDDLSSMI